MPQQHSTTSHLATFLIVCVFVLALFPGLFVSIFWAPYNSLARAYCVRVRISARRFQSCRGMYTSSSKLEYRLKLSKQRRTRECHANTVDDRAQKSITLPSRSRGSYLITDEILKQVPEIKSYKTGLLNLFVQHTSCAPT
jgi:hypothetical protein